MNTLNIKIKKSDFSPVTYCELECNFVKNKLPLLKVEETLSLNNLTISQFYRYLMNEYAPSQLYYHDMGNTKVRIFDDGCLVAVGVK